MTASAGLSRHGPDCGCHRCRGFEKGNDLGVHHGAYATVQLGSRVDELVDGLRDLVPVVSASDEPALRLLALSLARLERAEVALEAAKPGEAGRLRQDALGWANSARRLLNDLGMTPTSRARLGLDVKRAQAADAALGRLAEQGGAIHRARLEAVEVEDG